MRKRMVLTVALLAFAGGCGQGEVAVSEQGGKARESVSKVFAAVAQYMSDNNLGKLPDNFTLQTLLTASGGNGPWLTSESDLKDPWGNNLILKKGGVDENPYTIISYGADGTEGGTGANADIIE